jgi:hypothetical protein
LVLPPHASAETEAKAPIVITKGDFILERRFIDGVLSTLRASAW